MKSQPIEILLVEDNPGDVRLVKEALKDGRVDNVLHVAVDGVEALEFLRHEGKFKGSTRPHVVLLDLNLPRRSGREVLAEIKSDPDLRSIPVVVLTTSDAQRDIYETYELAANAYVTKPTDLEQFMAVVKAIESFWLTIVQLPPTPVS